MTSRKYICFLSKTVVFSICYNLKIELHSIGNVYTCSITIIVLIKIYILRMLELSSQNSIKI